MLREGEAYRRWHAFRYRYREVFLGILEDHPGFWEAVQDIWKVHLAETTTTRGAVVVEIPAVRDAETQTSEPGRSSRSVQTQASPSTRPSRAESTQTGGWRDLWDDLQIHARQQAAQKRQRGRARDRSGSSRRAPRPSSSTRGGEGCWNCGDPTHRYSGCPEPRREEFCYRCGQRGTTLRDCPRCREEWRRSG